MTPTAETTETVQVNRVYIKATPRASWDAITKPEWTEKFGLRSAGRIRTMCGGQIPSLSKRGNEGRSVR